MQSVLSTRANFLKKNDTFNIAYIFKKIENVGPFKPY